MIYDYRNAYNATVFIVSHNMEDMAQIADKLIVLSGGNMVAFDKTENVFKDHLEDEHNKNKFFTNEGNNFIKFKGKRIIVESGSKDLDFISLRPVSKNNAVLKNRGMVLNNGTVILSECYIYLG